MKLENWPSQLPKEFPSESRVWIYQSNRPLNEHEISGISKQLRAFCAGWISHNRPVKGWATVLFDQFILIMADDTRDRLCGSAVDNSIHLMKDLEHEYNISLLDRMLLAFWIEDKVKILPMKEIENALDSGMISAGTLYFNNAVSTRRELENEWIGRMESSYLWRRLAKRMIS